MSLDSLRNKIDRIDAKMIEILNERAELCQSIGKHKLKSRKGIYAPDREKQVLDNIRKTESGADDHGGL